MDKEFWLSLLTAFVITAALGPVLIPVLHKLKFGQSIRDCGPKEHLKKAGTPTMGGILILIGIISCLIWCKITVDLQIALILILGHGFIGFLDDFIKIVKKHNLGLMAWQKIVLQLILVLGFIWYVEINNFSTVLWVPGFNYYWNWGYGYYILVFFLLLGTTNAVNLTDGLDGLVCSVTLPVSLALGFFSFTLGLVEIEVLAASIIGSLLGFLIYNHHPARIFMGDTGSLALGGAVAAISILVKCELLLLVFGIVYVVEALSVILQVASYKLRHGKRIFRMAPLHHHYELGGWSETKTVMIFTLISFIFCGFSFVLWVAKFVI